MHHSVFVCVYVCVCVCTCYIDCMVQSVLGARQDCARRIWCGERWIRSTTWRVSRAPCVGRSCRLESSCFLYRCALWWCDSCLTVPIVSFLSLSSSPNLPFSQGEKFLCEKCYQLSIQSLAASNATSAALPTATTNMPKSEALKFGKCNSFKHGMQPFINIVVFMLICYYTPPTMYYTFML